MTAKKIIDGIQQYLWNILILIDCAIDSVLFASSPFETISSRMWRKREHKFAAFMVVVIDTLAWYIAHQKNHCQKSEQARPFYEGYEVWR